MISKKQRVDLNEQIGEIQNPETTSKQETTSVNRIFSCIEPGCSRVFQSFSNLESHLLVGKHRIEKKTDNLLLTM